MSGDYGLCADPDAEFAAEYPDPLSKERLFDLAIGYEEDGVIAFDSPEQRNAYDNLPTAPANMREFAQRRALGLPDAD